MNKEDKLIHVELLEDLLNKQRVLYTRMSLSDDPDAKMMKKEHRPTGTDVGVPS